MDRTAKIISDKTIWKFRLQIEDSQSIEMPEGAEILTVQEQGETAVMWAIVDPTAPTERRYFRTYGTGHKVHYEPNLNRKYIGTYQIRGGVLVFHVFEEIG